jgi:hypothetical protein
MGSERPVTGTCANCGRAFTLNIKGRPAKFCRPACRVASFEKAHPCAKGTRVPFADQVASRIWQAMQDANIVPSDRPLPPMRKTDAA